MARNDGTTVAARVCGSIGLFVGAAVVCAAAAGACTSNGGTCVQAVGVEGDVTGHDTDTCTVTISKPDGTPVAIYAFPPPTECCAEHTCQECRFSNTCNLVMGPQTQCDRQAGVADGGMPQGGVEVGFDATTADALTTALGGANFLFSVSCGATTIIGDRPGAVSCERPM